MSGLIVRNTLDYNFDWNDLVKAYAYDNAGNWEYDWAHDPFYGVDIPYSFTHFSFCNQYRGYIGRFFIIAEFENEPQVTPLGCEK